MLLLPFPAGRLHRKQSQADCESLALQPQLGNVAGL